MEGKIFLYFKNTPPVYRSLLISSVSTNKLFLGIFMMVRLGLLLRPELLKNLKQTQNPVPFA